MKNTLLTITTALTLAACGGPSNSDLATTPNAPEIDQDETHIVLPLEVDLTSVKVESAEPPAQGLWTEITISVNLPCSLDLVSFTFDHDRVDDEVVVYASAFAAQKIVQGEMVCQAFSQIDRTFTVPGIIAESQVRMMNLQGNQQAYGSNVDAIRPLRHITVTNTRSLCPEDMTCVMDGTIVTLEAAGFGCFDKLGNVAYYGSQSPAELESGTAKLAISALGFHDMRSLVALCQALPVYTFEVTLPLVFADVDGIELNILK